MLNLLFLVDAEESASRHQFHFETVYKMRFFDVMNEVLRKKISALTAYR